MMGIRSDVLDSRGHMQWMITALSKMPEKSCIALLVSLYERMGGNGFMPSSYYEYTLTTHSSGKISLWKGAHLLCLSLDGVSYRADINHFEVGNPVWLARQLKIQALL